jgi:hypothetical protein
VAVELPKSAAYGWAATLFKGLTDFINISTEEQISLLSPTSLSHLLVLFGWSASTTDQSFDSATAAYPNSNGFSDECTYAQSQTARHRLGAAVIKHAVAVRGMLWGGVENKFEVGAAFGTDTALTAPPVSYPDMFLKCLWSLPGIESLNISILCECVSKAGFENPDSLLLATPTENGDASHGAAIWSQVYGWAGLSAHGLRLVVSRLARVVDASDNSAANFNLRGTLLTFVLRVVSTGS